MDKYISNHNRTQLYYLVLYLLLVATIPIRSAWGGDLHLLNISLRKRDRNVYEQTSLLKFVILQYVNPI